jgi:D-glycero-D-manno-heptose 1,7-bisphosphate phosphatase
LSDSSDALTIAKSAESFVWFPRISRFVGRLFSLLNCAAESGSYSCAKLPLMNRALFLDRDGTLIAEKDYLHLPEQVAFVPGSSSALKRLQEAGFKLIMLTNQSGVGRGYFPLSDVHRVHDHIARELEREGVRLDKIYIAPEAPDQPSRGRKPSPQFVFDARHEFNLDLARSYMVGDKWIDVECALRAGLKQALLVRTGYGARVEQENTHRLNEAIVVNDLPAAADWILAHEAAAHPSTAPS